MSVDAKRVQAVFLAAVEIADTAKRTAYLEQECNSDPDLRQRVEGLLKAHVAPASILAGPVVAPIEGTSNCTLPLDADQALPFTSNRPQESATMDTGSIEDEGPSPLEILQLSTKPGSLGRLGHYEVLEVLGEGGFGTVVKAYDEKLHRMIAIKIMSPRLAATSPARKRFLREARSSAAIRHENIVDIHAIEEQPIPFLVMEYVAGETLQQRLDRVGPFDSLEVLRIGVQIAHGLAAAHAMGKIHRDIKPANILLENGIDRVKITDFGLARAADDASLTQSGLIAGTPMYMAPEQAQGVSLDHRADLFSYGSVLYVMCSGRPPFRASTTLAVLKRVADDTPRAIREIIPEVPEWLCDIITKLHAKNPNERFQSAQEVAGVLSKYLSELQVHGKVQSLVQTTPKQAVESMPTATPTRDIASFPSVPPRPRRRLVIAAAVLLCIIVGVSMTEATGVTRLRATVIRIFTPDGTLVVETNDPGVKVTIEGDGGLIITGAGLEEIRLRPGSYKVHADRDGKKVLLDRELVSISKGGREVVKVKLEAPPVAAKTANVKTTELTPEEIRERQAAEVLLRKGASVSLWSADFKAYLLEKPGQSWPAGTWHVHEVFANRLPALTPADLFALRDFPRLRGLNVTASLITTAAVLDQVEGGGVAELRLSGVPTTSKDVARIAGMKNLSALYLWGAGLSDDDIAPIANLPLLSDVNVGGNRITDESMKQLARLPLKRLYVSHTKVTDVGLAWLHSCQNLMVLKVSDTGVTAEGVASLQKALPNCEVEWVKDKEKGK